MTHSGLKVSKFLFSISLALHSKFYHIERWENVHGIQYYEYHYVSKVVELDLTKLKFL